MESMSKNTSTKMDGMNMNHQGGVGMMMMMMQMTFYASNEVTLFFDSWKTTNGWEMFGSCLAMIALGVVYESFKTFRQSLLRKNQTEAASEKAGYGSIGGDDVQIQFRTRFRQISRLSHILQAFLHVIQIFFGYFLMLAFMTYNAYICISVLIGAGLGYLFFGSNDPQAVGDHCNM